MSNSNIEIQKNSTKNYIKNIQKLIDQKSTPEKILKMILDAKNDNSLNILHKAEYNLQHLKDELDQTIKNAYIYLAKIQFVPVYSIIYEEFTDFEDIVYTA